MQRELPFGMILDVAYIGNLQRHQSISFDLNSIPLGTAFNPKYIRPGVTGANFFGTVNATAHCLQRNRLPALSSGRL